MAQEIGVAYVALLPSAKGFGRALEGQIDGAVDAGEKKSSGFFKNVVKGASLAVAGAVTAVGAITLGKGLARALNIEDAQAKLKGLGNDAQTVEAIMTDALAAVRGTAFGLDTAATVAATAVAAGIKPGQELEKYLRLTADAATIAGVSMEEMGSILNKTTTSGKVFTEELNQLADRGLPIFTWLQDEYGVTAEELRKMVSAGEVDAATFRKVIEENIGGAALASGDTTRGALANIGAALGRLGAVFTGPALDSAKTFFGEVIILIDGITDRVRPAAERWSEAFQNAFEIDGLGEKALGVIDSLIRSFTDGPIAELVKAISPVVPLVAGLAASLGGVLGEAARELFDALEPVIPQLAEALTEAIIELSPALVDLIEALIPVIPPLAELAADVLPILVDILKELLPVAEKPLRDLASALEAVLAILDLLAGNSSAQEFVDAARNYLGDDLVDVVMRGADAIWAVIGAFQTAAGVMAGVAAVVGGILSSIAETFRGAFYLIQTIVAGAILIVQGLITGNMGQISSVISNTLARIAGFFSETWGKISGALITAWAAITGQVRSGASNAVNAVIDTVQSLPGRAVAALANIGGLLYRSGRALIQGFVDGIRSMVGAVGDAVDSVLSWASGFFPNSPAKRGTFSGPGWPRIADGGAALLDQFASGVRSEASSLESAFNYSLAIGSPSIAGVGAQASMPRELVVVDADRQLIGRMRVEADASVRAGDRAGVRVARGRMTVI